MPLSFAGSRDTAPACFLSCGLGGGAALEAWLQPDGTAAALEVLSPLVASGSKLMGEKGEVLWPIKVTESISGGGRLTSARNPGWKHLVIWG